jgi:hypothetical protein
MNSQETGIKYFHEKMSLSNDSSSSDNLQIRGETLVEETATAAIYVRIQKWNYHFFTAYKRCPCAHHDGT